MPGPAEQACSTGNRRLACFMKLEGSAAGEAYRHSEPPRTARGCSIWSRDQAAGACVPTTLKVYYRAYLHSLRGNPTLDEYGCQWVVLTAAAWRAACGP